MADSRRGKGRLVADRRYPKKAAAKAKPRKSPTMRRKSAKPKVSRGGIVGFFTRIIGWFLRFFFRLFVRAGVVIALIVAAFVGYTYTTLPEVSAALDGRARGSVQLLDRDGVAFAWRGDQFGGVVTAESVSPHLKNAVVATEDKQIGRASCRERV